MAPNPKRRKRSPEERLRRRRLRLGALGLLLVGLLFGPFLVPQADSGVADYRTVAGDGAIFDDLLGFEVHLEIEEYSGSEPEPPLIVLLHGFGSSTFSWREVSQPLSEFGEVISYDRPAFGLTQRPTSWTDVNPYGLDGNIDLLGALIARYGAARDIVLVGHSAGGAIATEFARRYPGVVKSLVLISPAILTSGGTPDWLSWIYQLPQLDYLGPTLVGGIATSGEQILIDSWFDGGKLTDEIWEGYRRPLQVKGWEKAFWEFNRAPRGSDLAQNLAEVITPALLITGDTDRIVSVADTERLATLLPSARLVVVPKSGHLAHEETPDAFMRAIEENADFLLR